MSQKNQSDSCILVTCYLTTNQIALFQSRTLPLLPKIPRSLAASCFWFKNQITHTPALASRSHVPLYTSPALVTCVGIYEISLECPYHVTPLDGIYISPGKYLNRGSGCQGGVTLGKVGFGSTTKAEMSDSFDPARNSMFDNVDRQLCRECYLCNELEQNYVLVKFNCLCKF